MPVLLGAGSQGEVLRVRDISSNRDFAPKSVHHRGATQTIALKEEFRAGRRAEHRVVSHFRTPIADESAGVDTREPASARAALLGHGRRISLGM